MKSPSKFRQQTRADTLQKNVKQSRRPTQSTSSIANVDASNNHTCFLSTDLPSSYTENMIEKCQFLQSSFTGGSLIDYYRKKGSYELNEWLKVTPIMDNPIGKRGPIHQLESDSSSIHQAEWSSATHFINASVLDQIVKIMPRSSPHGSVERGCTSSAVYPIR